MLFLSQAALNVEQRLSKIKHTSFTQHGMRWIEHLALSPIEMDRDHWLFICNMARDWLNIVK